MNKKSWSYEEKLAIVLEILKGEVPVTEICQKHQVSPTQAYRWRDIFLDGAKRALSDGRTKAVKDELVEENRKLKELIGQQALIIDAQKKILGR